MGDIIEMERNVKLSSRTPDQYQQKDSNKKLIKYRYEDHYNNLLRYYQKIMFDVYYNEYIKYPKK